MTSKSAFDKRVQRRIAGRPHVFFCVTAPGLEPLCLEELRPLLERVDTATAVEGGVEFTGRIPLCCQANLHLRTASRILMRMDEFSASNFRQLEKKLAEFPWELYLHKGRMPEIAVSSKRSRLYHKTAIAERVQESIRHRLNSPDLPTGETYESQLPQKIFVRIVIDRFTLSIDSSGELLYKRGIKTYATKAPIRETIAAAVLKLAGYDPQEPLMDPMCGAGTFSIEAALMAQNIPPGWFREFAFMGWPCFRPRQWQYIKTQCEKSFTPAVRPFIFSSDKDQSACSKLEEKVNEFNLSQSITVSCKDFFTLSPVELTSQTGLVVINPPYGLRLGTRKESKDILNRIIRTLQKGYAGWKVAIIVPDFIPIAPIPLNLTSHPFFHGGLWMTLLTGKL